MKHTDNLIINSLTPPLVFHKQAHAHTHTHAHHGSITLESDYL